MTEEGKRVRSGRRFTSNSIARDEGARDRDFDTVGWDSTYNRRAAQRRGDEGAGRGDSGRIAALGGKRILEIGLRYGACFAATGR